MIKVAGLRKQFRSRRGDVVALDGVSFDVPEGELLTLLGPSGCGKTTTLRSIAGLEHPDEGEIRIGNRQVFSSQAKVVVPPNKRRIGMVFQSYAVWPHMTVYQNVAYPLKPLKLGGDKERERVKQTLDLVGLAAQIDRPAPYLSGGQQQRVALARALVAEPEVLLLDEPLSNLDAKLREDMRVEIRSLQQRLGITAVYVTHDQAEALAISDTILVMSQGRIVEEGAPRKIYDRPRSRIAAEFIGAANVVQVTSIQRQNGGCVGMLPWGQVHFDPAETDGTTYLLIRPEDVELVPVGSTGPNVWDANVTHVSFVGGYSQCRLHLGGVELRAHVPRRTEVQVGDRVGVRVAPIACTPILEE